MSRPSTWRRPTQPGRPPRGPRDPCRTGGQGREDRRHRDSGRLGLAGERQGGERHPVPPDLDAERRDADRQRARGALIIGGYAAISLSKVNRTLAAQADKVARIDDIATL